jgi:hypothetical protein
VNLRTLVRDADGEVIALRPGVRTYAGRLAKDLREARAEIARLTREAEERDQSMAVQARLLAESAAEYQRRAEAAEAALAARSPLPTGCSTSGGRP